MAWPGFRDKGCIHHLSESTMFRVSAGLHSGPSGLAPSPPGPVLDLPRLTGAAAWSRLPPAVQRRFAPGHAAVVYAGCMDLRCSAIGRVYAALARLLGGPLTGLQALGVPSLVRVGSNAQGGVVWERCLQLGPTSAGGGRGGRVCRVRSTKEIGPDGRLMERTDGGLSMSLEVFEDRGRLVFTSRRYWLVLARGQGRCWRIPVPALLSPGRCRVEHADLGDGQFRYSLSMVHPIWGETFHQTGVFSDPYDRGPSACGARSADPTFGDIL